MPDDPLDPKAEYWDGRSYLGRHDRRTNLDIAARVDACIEAARAPLLRLIEEQEQEVVRLQRENDELKGRVAGLEGRVEGIREGRTILATYKAEEGSYDDE